VTAVQLSIALPSFSAGPPGDWGSLFDVARAADTTGIDRVVVSDHVVFGENLGEYGRPEIGGAAGGTQPTGPDGLWLEPLTTLSVIAGMTSRVRLGTNIIVAALRRPVVLAKATSTLDVLSGGRLDLGVGAGWQREEYQAAGLPFEGRGKLLDHTLDVVQTLWREQRASHSSAHLEFEGIHQMPKPAQPGGVPIWVSGTLHAAVLRRIARFGSGWIPWGPDAADPAAVGRMREGVAALGRDPAGLQVVGTLPTVVGSTGAVDVAATVDAIGPLVAAGCTDLRGKVPLPAAGQAAAEGVLGPLVAAFRQAVGREPLIAGPGVR
jgi:probable F420-dependent oxidoreductase